MSCLMNYGDHTEKLLAYCSGRLGADETSRIALHLKSCRECALICAAQASVWNALDTWQPAPVSRDFDRRLFARIEAEKTTQWWDRAIAKASESLRPFFAQPALPLSAAALVIAAGFVLDHPAGFPRSGGPISARDSAVSIVNRVEAEKMEATLDDLEMLRQFDVISDDKESTRKSM
jgi:anti-sigma factor RsiW